MDPLLEARKKFKQTLKNIYSRLKLAQPIGGYPLHGDEPISPFFIVGSGRCGTTLLRRILFSHPDICIPPETYVLHKCIKTFAIYRHLPWDQLVQLTLSTLEYHPKFSGFDLSLRPLAGALRHVERERRSLAHILDRFYHFYAEEKELDCVIWGDKTPKNTYHLDRIHSVFPKARYIHLIRHGADVVHSYLRTGLRQDLIHSAKEWKRSVLLARSFGTRYPDRYIEVRYEDLVEDPPEWIQRICSFLDIEYLEGMVQASQSVTNKMGDVPKYDHLSSVKDPITTERIGRGIDSFSERQMKEIEGIIGETLAKFGYQI